jgi:uncharacterized repeat protein (TIGR03803 family)
VAFDCFTGADPAVVFPFEGGFFGSTYRGGFDTNGNCLVNGGTIYSLDLIGQLTSRATFRDSSAYSPNALLARLPDGTIWGSTSHGGTGDRGTIFKLATNSQLVVVTDFGATAGYESRDGLTVGADGDLYGATAYGGGGPYFGSGTIFKVVSNSTIVTLHQFQLFDGYDPVLSAADRFGNLYGDTEGGGLTNEHFQLGMGTVFQINTNGTFTNLIVFNGTNGYYPFAGLTVDDDGTVFGCTVRVGNEFDGGNSGKGTLFRISTDKVFSTLHEFSGGTDGEFPYTIMAIGRDGKLYGCTGSGGAFGCGTLFSITKEGSLTTLYSFNSQRNTICLSFGSDGCLYAVQQLSWGYIMRFSIPMSPIIRSLQKIGGGIELSWYSVAGQSYQLQFTDSLNSTNWIDSGSPTLATNGTTTVTDSVNPTAQRFYRVALLP